MILAIASGKGGTGKTTVAVGLALSVPGPVRLLDCDVEEPNCHLFLNPEVWETRDVTIPVPEVDSAKCDGCGECSGICMYGAIAVLRGKARAFPELCHGCGGCFKVCPAEAIAEADRKIGVVEIGTHNGIGFVQGSLNVGQPMAPPVIRAVKRHISADGLTIIDCPPGTSCPVVTAAKGSDFAILVTEPTPFGLHDLRIAVETMRQLGLHFGVVVNRADIGDGRVTEYCLSENIPVLMEIPHDRRIAEAYSRGVPIISALPGLRDGFAALFREITRQAKGKGASNCAIA